MDRMPEVGDVLRFAGYYVDDTWRVTKVHLNSFDGCYVGENPELIHMHGRHSIKDLNTDLSRRENVEDEFVRYVKSVRKEAGIVDDRP